MRSALRSLLADTPGKRRIAQRHRRVCRTDIRVHPHRVAGSSGGPRDLWLHREVTQRLIYFTVDRLPLLLPRLLYRCVLPLFLSSRVALTYERPSSRHCAVYMSGQPSLHAATSYLHEKGVAFFPLRCSLSTSGRDLSRSRPRKALDEAPLPWPRTPAGDALSVNTVHHYRRGSLYFKNNSAGLFTALFVPDLFERRRTLPPFAALQALY